MGATELRARERGRSRVCRRMASVFYMMGGSNQTVQLAASPGIIVSEGAPAEDARSLHYAMIYSGRGGRLRAHRSPACNAPFPSVDIRVGWLFSSHDDVCFFLFFIFFLFFHFFLYFWLLRRRRGCRGGQAAHWASLPPEACPTRNSSVTCRPRLAVIGARGRESPSTRFRIGGGGSSIAIGRLAYISGRVVLGSRSGLPGGKRWTRARGTEWARWVVCVCVVANQCARAGQ